MITRRKQFGQLSSITIAGLCAAVVGPGLGQTLPTGFGKSLIYQALPLVFDHVRKVTGHIVVVDSKFRV